jgi:FlaA1/EpsC-like NDP-sugar epimerase
MGKQIKIFDIIKELVRLKKIINPEYTPSYHNIGLQNGEKLNEKLSLNKKLYKTLIQNVYYVEEPIYESKLVESILDNLKKFKVNGYANKSKILLKDFFKEEK